MSRTALVTGASGGIGFEFARLLAKNKYNLVLIARTQAKLNDIADDFRRSYGVRVIVIGVDLSKPDFIEKVLGVTRKNGLVIDILVNNAGLGDWGPFVDSSWEKQERMLRLNIFALTQLTRFVLPDMVKRRSGRILNVASTAAFQPGPLMSVYYATKAYVLSFSLAIAEELNGTGVFVTCLCPGPTATGFQKVAFSKEIRLTRGRRLPLAREVAEYGFRAMLRGRRVAVHGFINKFIVFSMRFFPQWVILRLVCFMQSDK